MQSGALHVPSRSLGHQQLSFARFDAKLEQRVAELRAEDAWHDDSGRHAGLQAVTGVQLLERVKSAFEGHYAVEHELRRGGVSVTFAARDPRVGRAVWLQVLRPEVGAVLSAERFLRQIEIHGMLTHPHIIPIIDAGEKEHLVYYVMPLLEGEWLRERLNREPHLPLDVTLRIGRDVAAALGYAHSQGIIHRDVKPDTVFLQGDRALLSEFSLASTIQQAESDRITRSGLVVGTPTYMSPEQAMGMEVDGRSDVYNLGTILFEMLAGGPPFSGPTVQAVLARRLIDAPSLKGIRPKIPKHVRKAIERALARAPADRYQTAMEFLEALAALLDALSGGSPPPRVREPAATPRGGGDVSGDRLRSALKRRYEVLHQIGRGGMASVWLAVDLQLNRRVAVKILLPDQVQAVDVKRFLEEIRFTAQLNHPHILQPIEAGLADGLPYFVMPYVEGGSLRHRLDRDKRLPLGDAVTIAKLVADALHFAHSNGVVHRDIKPENILIHQGYPMVADFGIAKSLRAGEAVTLTRPGYVRGTPPYCSPEQMAAAPVDARTDVYSLACVLCEMLSGEAPLLGAKSAAKQITTSDMAVREVILKGLAQDPDERHTSAAEFRDELSAAYRLGKT